MYKSRPHLVDLIPRPLYYIQFSTTPRVEKPYSSTIMKIFSTLRIISTFLVVLSASVSAKVYHVSVPDKASPGEIITAILSSSSYIQNWDDFGVSSLVCLLVNRSASAKYFIIINKTGYLGSSARRTRMRWMYRSRDWVSKPLVRVIFSYADWGSKELMNIFL